MDSDAVKRFITLSGRILEEADIDCLLDLSRQRRSTLQRIRAERQALSSDELEACIRRENEIVSKFERMKAVTLEQMEKSANTRKAIRKYAGNIVLPPQAVYFDIKT